MSNITEKLNQSNYSMNQSKAMGTIHVTVLKATSLPNLDFAKQQNPYVKISFKGLENSWARTDSITHGGRNPIWSTNDNRDLDISYEVAIPKEGPSNVSNLEAILYVEVRNDSYGEHDDLIGIGNVNATSVIEQHRSEPLEVIVPLKEKINGMENRGDVKILISCRPPMRKAILGLVRASKIFELRDSIVSALTPRFLINMMPNQVMYLINELKKIINNNKKIFAATIGSTIVAGTAIASFIAIPVLLFILITMPFWCIPVFTIGLFTSPIWIPIILTLGAFALISTMILSFFGLTSVPMRRHAGRMLNYFKETNIGKKVIFQGTVHTGTSNNK